MGQISRSKGLTQDINKLCPQRPVKLMSHALRPYFHYRGFIGRIWDIYLRIQETQHPSETPTAKILSQSPSVPVPSWQDTCPGHGFLATTWQLPMPQCTCCSGIPSPCSWVTAGSWRGMNRQVGFKNQSNPPFQGQTQVELHRVFSKRPPEPFCSSLLSPCSSQCTCERNN